MRKADVYRTLEELVPLQVNVQAVASREVSFANGGACCVFFCKLVVRMYRAHSDEAGRTSDEEEGGRGGVGAKLSFAGCIVFP